MIKGQIEAHSQCSSNSPNWRHYSSSSLTSPEQCQIPSTMISWNSSTETWISNEAENIAGDTAMKAFKKLKTEARGVILSSFHIKSKAQLYHVVELLAAGLSFCQILKAAKTDLENPGAAAMVGCMSPGEASNISRLACATGSQAFADPMHSYRPFSIGIDESNDEGDHPNLNSRIQFPAVVGYEGGPDVEYGFHLLAIPLFRLTPDGQIYAQPVIKMLDALFSDSRMKLIRSSIDAAGTTTIPNCCLSGHLRNESLCREAFYKLWCFSHQNNVLTIAAVNCIDESGVIIFEKTLTNVIRILRCQKNPTAQMESRCPYFVTVSWASLEKVCTWLIGNLDNEPLPTCKRNQSMHVLCPHSKFFNHFYKH